MVDFINEVEEELRKDEYNRLLKRYGPFLIGLIVAVVAATGYMEYRKSSADKAARAVSFAYVQAGEKVVDNPQGAVTDFIAISKKAPSGYAGLSLMRAAAIELDQGNRERAVELFDQAAATFEMPRHAQLAQLKAGYVLAGDGRYADVANRMGPLAAKDQPYEYLARELLGFAAMQDGNLSGAREQFSYLDNIPGVSPSVKARAAQYLSLMKVDSAAKALAPADETVTDDMNTPNPEGSGDE